MTQEKNDILLDLSGQVGYAETIELLRAWGGRRLWVPKEAPPDHPIALAIGPAAAGQLAYYYGGTMLELPAERNHLIRVRNDCIFQDLKAEPVRTVAMRYGLTPRHVRYIRQQEEDRLSKGGRRSTDPARGDIPPSQ